MARLEVEIGAEIKEFQSKLASALKGFDKLKAKEKELKKSFDAGAISQKKYYDALAKNSTKLINASTHINKYKKAIQSADGANGNLVKGTVSGTSAMTAFSRTIQDAPFGIMGVSNNITNLTEQFGYLKNKTGSAKGALTAMLRDLKGFGGISLLISVATSAMLVFGDKIFDAKKKTDDFTKALGDISTKGIVEFKTLTEVLTNTTSSQKEQSKAIQILKDKYSDFDTSLLTTKGNYEKGKLAIDAYIGSLVQQAKAQAALTLIQEKQSKILQLEEEKFSKIREKGFKNEKEFNNKIQAEQERVDKITSVRKKSQQASELNTLKRIKDINSKELSELKTQITNLTKLANVKDLILFGGKENKPTKGKKQTVIIPIDIKFEKAETPELIDIDLMDSDAEWSVIDWGKYYNLKQFDSERMKLMGNMMMLNENIKSLIESTLSNTFSNLGQTIGSAMAQGGDVLQAIGNSILQGLSNFIGKMGSMLVEYGTLAVLKGKLDLAIATGGAVSIGAGIAAIAVGTALSALSGAIGSFSSSGGNSSSNANTGTNFSSGFNGGYSSNRVNEVEGVLRGSDIYFALSSFFDRNPNLSFN